MKRYRFIFLLFFVLAIAGCGDGGGGRSSSDDNGGGNDDIVYDDTTALCFNSFGSTVVSIRINGTLGSIPALDFSKDGLNWSPIALVNENSVEVAALSDGEKVYLRAHDANNFFSEDLMNYIQFIITGTGSIAASGNIMSLLDKTLISTEIPCDMCFLKLFMDCTALKRAPALPATTLAVRCYGSMFSGCTSLTAAPALPATTLAELCYASMFYDCTSLVTTPTLPATTLAVRCYDGMFFDCTSLTTAPALPATTLADNCYEGMFYDCTNLTAAPALPATTLADGCYTVMFKGCTSLTTAPALPATTLAEDCYLLMFSGCTSLTAAPALPATTLADKCYRSMFYNCQNIKNITVYFTKWTDASWTDATKEWVVGIPSGGTFTCPNSLPDEFGIDRIPTGWTKTDL